MVYKPCERTTGTIRRGGMSMGRAIKNISNKKFNHWIVIGYSHICNHGDAMWSCRCELCDKYYTVRSDSIQSGRSTKCRSCASKERIYGYAGPI